MLLGRSEPALEFERLPSPGEYSAFHPFLRGVFSQWHESRFRLHGREFVTAEQWMMFAKATLFGDADRAGAILHAEHPAMQKRLGQLVTSFDQDVWDRWKIDIVHEGNLAKFAQNEGARRQLLGTAPAMLVEANQRDWVWGAGLSDNDARISQPGEWRGSNLLGRILTLVRDELA